VKKKEKKYFDYVQIRKPTIRLLIDVFYRQSPEKALGLRVDSLSQLISYADVNSSGNYLIYDAGTSGLLPAAFLNSMGPSTKGRLVHLHPGNFPQKQAVSALNLTEEHEKKCISVNIYSVLRQFYQENEKAGNNSENGQSIDEDNKKRKHENDENAEENPAKRPNIDNDKNENGNAQEVNVEISSSSSAKEEKKQKWQLENAEAIEVLKEKFDSLTIVSKEDPITIVNELLQFLHPGRPIVIFHNCKEVLMECYTALKNTNKIINLRLTTNFMRNHQVLPMRTHPHVQMPQGSSGWLLAGFYVK
jgi:tRNA (adenine-N(1)-)-methyltransferase non-catalytic subunit